MNFFLGFSVLAHILVIVLNKLSRKPKRSTDLTPTNTVDTRDRRTVNIVIAGLVTTFVIFNVSLIINNSIDNKYSTIKLATAYFESQKNQNYSLLALANEDEMSEEYDQNDNPDDKIAQIIAIANPDECTRLVKSRMNYYQNSLSDYLKDTGRDYSLEARIKLANQLDIVSYRGLTTENMLLFENLVREDLAQNDNLEACKLDNSLVHLSH